MRVCSNVSQNVKQSVKIQPQPDIEKCDMKHDSTYDYQTATNYIAKRGEIVIKKQEHDRLIALGKDRNEANRAMRKLKSELSSKQDFITTEKERYESEISLINEANRLVKVEIGQLKSKEQLYEKLIETEKVRYELEKKAETAVLKAEMAAEKAKYEKLIETEKARYESEKNAELSMLRVEMATQKAKYESSLVSGSA